MDYVMLFGKTISFILLMATIYFAWRRNIPRTLICGVSCVAAFVLEV